jgi:hypothetical protein
MIYTWLLFLLLSSNHPETQFGATLMMIYITFPLGTLAYFFLSFSHLFLPLDFLSFNEELKNVLLVLVVFLPTGIVSYYQWFVWIPKLWNMFRTRIRKKI